MLFVMTGSFSLSTSMHVAITLLLLAVHTMQWTPRDHDTSDVEDSEISLSLDVADAGPPTSTDDDDDDDDDNDLESFWQQLNAARSTALERMKFSSWASPDHSNEKPSTTNHFNQIGGNESEIDTDSAIEPACGVPAVRPRYNSRIVGGREARRHSWPFLCSLQRYVGGPGNPWVHICGSCIIARRWILTAGHCVKAKAKDPTQYRIVAGEHDLRLTEGTERVYDVEKIITPEGFGKNYAGHDIALLRLSRDVQYSAAVGKICLPDNPPPDRANCVAIGWGDTQGTGRDEVLNEVIVPVLPRSTCRRRDWYGRRIKPDMMCAGYEHGGRDSCSGDSGGPLVRQPGFGKPWQVVGITSWGKLCGLRRKPGVYTRVYQYLDWINQHVKQ